MVLKQSLRLIRSAPLRLVLAVPLVLPLLCTVGLTGWLSHRNGQQAVNTLASELHQEVALRVGDHLTHYFSIAKPILDLTTEELTTGGLTIDDFDALESHFLSQSRVFDQVNQLYLGRRDGEFIGIVNLGGDARAVNTTAPEKQEMKRARATEDPAIDRAPLELSPSQFSSERLFLFSLGDRDTPDAQLNAVSYDLRQRPWYRLAAQRSTTVWSEIYPWASVKTLGLTLAQPYYGQTNQQLGILGVDLSLNRISQFLQQLPVSQTGRVFILERSGFLVASSTPQEPLARRRGKLQRITAEELSDRIIPAIARQIRQEFIYLSQIQTPQQRHYVVEGEPHLVQVTPWRDAFGLDWLLVVALPESVFMEQIDQNTKVTILLSCAALGTALVLSLLSARWVIAPILRLNQATQRLAAGQWAEPLEIDRQDEVGQLARVFNQMSLQLSAAFSGLEEKVAQRTEQLQAQTEQLQEKERFLRAIYDGVEAAIFTMDVQSDGSFRCVDVNQAHSRMSSLSRAEIIGKSPEDYLEPSAAAAVLRHYRESLVTRTRVSHENCLNHQGQSRWWLTTVNPLENAAGQVYRLIVTGLNITQRKEAELRLAERTQELSETLQSLKSTQEKLIEAAKLAALGKLVAGVAHEVNTPVGTAILAASTLDNETQSLVQVLATLQGNTGLGTTGLGTAGLGTTADLEEYLELAIECSQIILENLNRAGILVQSFQQIAVDQTRLQPRKFAVTAYIREVIQSLSPQTSPTAHRIEIQGNETAILDSDPGALAQVISSLVMNSLTHAYGAGTAGLIQINLEVQGDRLELSYRDDGKGIAPEHLGRIFEPFFTTASLAKNSGLGLHLVYNLVTQRLQGAIAVESTVGVGTTFLITLPQSAPAESPSTLASSSE